MNITYLNAVFTATNYNVAYIAMDGDGSVWAYKEKPRRILETWAASGAHEEKLVRLSGTIDESALWQNSLRGVTLTAECSELPIPAVTFEGCEYHLADERIKDLEDYNYIARDRNGSVYIYSHRPNLGKETWDTGDELKCARLLLSDKSWETSLERLKK